MMRARVAALILVAACANKAGNHDDKQPAKEKPMEAPATALDYIPRLVAKLPFQHEDVASLTGATLALDEQTSTGAFAVFKSSDAKGHFKSVEVRQSNKDKNGMVILDLADGPCITQQEAIAKYGDPTDLSIPTPHQPADAPQYLVYKQKWGKLKLGFARTGTECLTTIVLDAI